MFLLSIYMHSFSLPSQLTAVWNSQSRPQRRSRLGPQAEMPPKSDTVHVLGTLYPLLVLETLELNQTTPYHPTGNGIDSNMKAPLA